MSLYVWPEKYDIYEILVSLTEQFAGPFIKETQIVATDLSWFTRISDDAFKCKKQIYQIHEIFKMLTIYIDNCMLD